MVAKTKILGLVMVLMALSAPMVYADNGGGDKDSWHQDGEWHHGQREHMMAHILNLSDDQLKQLKDLHQTQKEAKKTILEQIKSNREAFSAEIVKATADMSKINDLQAQLKVLQAQVIDNKLNSILAIKKVLTPEQFAGYIALKKEREITHKFGRSHGKFGPKGGICKKGDEHKDLGEHADKDHDEDGQ